MINETVEDMVLDISDIENPCRSNKVVTYCPDSLQGNTSPKPTTSHNYTDISQHNPHDQYNDSGDESEISTLPPAPEDENENMREQIDLQDAEGTTAVEEGEQQIDPALAGHIKSNRSVTRDLRREEFKSLLSKDEKKIEVLIRIAAAQEDTNKILKMFYEKMFSS